MIIDYIINIIEPQVSLNKVLMHFTNDGFAARNILSSGFNYSEYYENSTLGISLDIEDLKYKYECHKIYGDYLIIICIPLLFFNNYSQKDISHNHDTLYDLGLSEYFPEDDQEYRLFKTFVYGCIDLKEARFFKNEYYGK